MALKEMNRLKSNCSAKSSFYALLVVQCLQPWPGAMAMPVHQLHAMKQWYFDEFVPETTVLHTACAIGNHWLIQLQIKAGVDITAMDSHS